MSGYQFGDHVTVAYRAGGEVKIGRAFIVNTTPGPDELPRVVVELLATGERHTYTGADLITCAVRPA